MTCTCVDIYYLHTTTDTISITMLYSQLASENIASPTDIVTYNQKINLDERIHMSNVKLGKCKLIMKLLNTSSSSEILLTMTNNLWYCIQPPSLSSNNNHTAFHVAIRSLNQTTKYELWHHRMGHVGKTTIDKLIDMVDGIPKLFLKIHYINFLTILLVNYSNI